MQLDIEIQDLPGIGKRYEVHGEHGGRVAVVIHNTGRRDVYAFDGGRGADPDADDDDAQAVVQFSDQQARKLGAILGGAYFKPSVVEEIEAVIGDLLIEWVTLDDNSPLVGHSLTGLDVRRKTGMTIVAIVRDRHAITMPEADEVLEGGDRLVVVGVREDFKAFQELIGEAGDLG